MQEAEALEAKKAAKRKVEEERIAKLSAADQKKVHPLPSLTKLGSLIGKNQVLERERKRSIRKQQTKLSK